MQLFSILRTFILFIALHATALTAFSQQNASSQVTTTFLQLSTQRTTVIVFAAGIADNGVDRGSPGILAKTVEGIDNVLKVKAASDTMLPTNLTVITKDGRVYRFLVSYNQEPQDDFFDFSDLKKSASSDGVRFSPNRLNDATIEHATAQLAAMPTHRRKPASKKVGMVRARTTGIFIAGGVMFFQLTVGNQSSIPYTLDFVRCYERDRKKSKRTSKMEKEVTPLQTSYQQLPTIATNDLHHPLVLAFDQFTINDSKYFMIELFEKQGDRHLVIRIKGKDILKAKPLTVSY